MAELRLLQLVSPALPIGAYAYSQGLEWAVEAGWVHDTERLAAWLRDQLEHGLARVDLPVLHRLLVAVSSGDEAALARWSTWLLASRETRELRADDVDRGRALVRLLRELGVSGAHAFESRGAVPLALAWALAATAWDIPAPSALRAYAWGWLENQVIAGVKLVPLGQVAGQRLLLELAPVIPPLCAAAARYDDDELGGTLPLLAIASARHETQYTRLFRS